MDMMDKRIVILNNLVFSRKTMKYTCFSNMSIYFLALMFGICIWIQTIFWNGHMVTVWSWEIEITFSITVCSLYLFTVGRYFSSTSILTCKQFKSNHTAACKLNKISNIIWVGSTESSDRIIFLFANFVIYVAFIPWTISITFLDTYKLIKPYS